ncbi:hypothetical protein [Streptomyces sp. AC550_RSS872]|nr:hypothetical protein [Streptomyces sp. AC550_RSS872]
MTAQRHDRAGRDGLAGQHHGPGTGKALADVSDQRPSARIS